MHYTFINPQTSLVYIVACLLVLGLGFALFSSPNNNAVMATMERRHFGVASSFLGTMRLTGQMLSMAESGRHALMASIW